MHLVRRIYRCRGFKSLCWRRRAWRWRGRPSPLLKVSSLFTSPLIQERVRNLAWMVASFWCTVRRMRDASPSRCNLRRMFFLIKIHGASSSFTWGFSHLIWCISLAVGRKDIVWMHQRLHHGLQCEGLVWAWCNDCTKYLKAWVPSIEASSLLQLMVCKSMDSYIFLDRVCNFLFYQKTKSLW